MKGFGVSEHKKCLPPSWALAVGTRWSDLSIGRGLNILSGKKNHGNCFAIFYTWIKLMRQLLII
jgi:hypothetical protein